MNCFMIVTEKEGGEYNKRGGSSAWYGGDFHFYFHFHKFLKVQQGPRITWYGDSIHRSDASCYVY